MELQDFAYQAAGLSRSVADFVMRELLDSGVPVTESEAYALVERLAPRVQRARRAVYRAQLVELGRQARTAGVELRPEPLAEYPSSALYDAVVKVCRLAPDSSNIVVDVLDEHTRELVATPVLPTVANKRDVRVVERVGRELGSRIARHVASAGRELVAGSAHNGSARFINSGEPAKAGYARVLSGRENCAFCTMLASRGPVYREDTVVRRKDGRRYHDGCDCIPVLAVEGEYWEGRAEYEALEQEWQSVTGDGKDQWKKWREHVTSDQFESGQYSPFVEAGSAPPRIGDVSRKGSKRVMRSAVSGANPTGDLDNCVRCTLAWFMRKHGYDVAAIPGGPDITAAEAAATLRDADGKRPFWVGEGEKPDGGAPKWKDLAPMFAKTTQDGDFGFIRYRRSGDYAHVAAWEVRDGIIVWIDPQKPDNDLELALEKAIPGTIRWTNLKGFHATTATVPIIEGEKK